jgi:cephalosporin hydroxylase
MKIVGFKPFPPHELMLMSAAMVWLRPRIVVEWGTNIGVSARVFHETNKHYGIGAEIHSVDLPDSFAHTEHPGHRRGLLVRGLPVFLHQGDGPEVAVSLLRERSCGDPLVFIDGDHRKESVLRDARTVLEAAPGAAMLFHDTFYQQGSTYNHGPSEAVREILEGAIGMYQVVDVGLGCPGMTLLVPSALQKARHQ